MNWLPLLGKTEYVPHLLLDTGRSWDARFQPQRGDLTKPRPRA
jgi:hypothetical protein